MALTISRVLSYAGGPKLPSAGGMASDVLAQDTRTDVSRATEQLRAQGYDFHTASQTALAYVRPDLYRPPTLTEGSNLSSASPIGGGGSPTNLIVGVAIIAAVLFFVFKKAS